MRGVKTKSIRPNALNVVQMCLIRYCSQPACGRLVLSAWAANRMQRAVHCMKCVSQAGLNMQDWRCTECGVCHTMSGRPATVLPQARGVPHHEWKTSHSASTSGSHAPDADNALRAGAADPFLNDQNYVLCVLSLEELGATGNKVRPGCGVKEAGGYVYHVLCCGCACTRTFANLILEPAYSTPKQDRQAECNVAWIKVSVLTYLCCASDRGVVPSILRSISVLVKRVGRPRVNSMWACSVLDKNVCVL